MEKRKKFFVGLLLVSLLSLGVVPSTFAQTCNPANLTPVAYGQRGSAVQNAQACLIEAGYDIPAGATGYYGAQTRAAVQAFYADWYGSWHGNNLGPRGVAELKSLLAGTPSSGTQQTGQQPSGQQDLSAIIAAVLAALQQAGVLPSTSTQQQPGAGEATVEVRLSASPAGGVVVKEGQSADVLGLRIISRNASSDVQRVRFDLTSSVIPTRVFSSFELYDGSTKLATVSAGDYVRTGTNVYQYTFTGFSANVAANSEKVLVIKAVVNPVVDSNDVGQYTVSVDHGYVRAVDAARVQHTPDVSGTVSRSFDVKKSTPTGVALVLYKDQNSPSSNNYAADSDRNYKDLEVLRFVLRADNDTLKVQHITTTIPTASNLTVTAAKLVDANGNVLDSVANPSTSGFKFQGVDFNTPLLTISAGQTATLKVLFDVTLNSGLAPTSTASVKAEVTGAVAEQSDGSTVPASASVVGDVQNLYTTAAAKWKVTSAQASVTTPDTGTSTLNATFRVEITAQRGDVYIPNTAFIASTTDSNGNDLTGGSVNVTPISGVETSGSDFIVRNGTTGVLEVQFARTPSAGWTAGYYRVKLKSMIWDTDSTHGANNEITTTFPGTVETNTLSNSVYITR